MKKRIAYMVFSSSIGGAESVVEELLRNIDKSTFQVYLITNDEILKKFEIDNIKKYSVGTLFNNKITGKIIKKMVGEQSYYKNKLKKKKKNLENFIQEEKIEIIHSNLIYDHYLNSLLQNSTIKKIMTIHGSHGLDTNSKYPFSHLDIENIYNKADIITSACEYFINILKSNNLGNKKFENIENGINNQLINEKRKTEISNGKLNLTYLGGTRLVKGWDLLVDALDIIVNKQGIKDIHLDVLREVPKDSEFYIRTKEKNLDNYINFIGYVGNGEHLSYISKNNLFVLPSRTEGIANTLMESVGLGKPILATDVGGTSEVVVHLENGYLCKPEAEELAKGLLYFYNFPEKLKEYADYNNQIQPNFYWQNIIKKYEDVYTSLL